MPSKNTTAQFPVQKNPHLSHLDRAPYELGHLLSQIPSTASDLTAAPLDTIQKAEAALTHAQNANTAVMCGLEALGKLVFIAGACDDHTLDRNSLADLGALISHLAVEGQFLQETQSNLRFALNKPGRNEP